MLVDQRNRFLCGLARRSTLVIPAAAARWSTGKRNHAAPKPNRRRPRRAPAAARWAARGAGAPAPARQRGAVRPGGGRVQPRPVHDGAQPVGPRRPSARAPAPPRFRPLRVPPRPRLRPPSAPGHRAPRRRRGRGCSLLARPGLHPRKHFQRIELLLGFGRRRSDTRWLV